MKRNSYLMKRNMFSRALSAKIRVIYHKILWVIVFRRNCGTLRVDPLLFLLYINECHCYIFILHFIILYINRLHKAMMHCSVNYFADDTNLLLIDRSLKKINKCINRDLKNLCQWIRSNRLSLNRGKTKIIIFINDTNR